MKKYKVFLPGQNFLFEVDGEPKKLGFYTTRFIEAPDEEQAKEKAISILRDDPALQACTLNQKSDAPLMFVEEITELESFGGFKPPGAGFTFYLEEPER